MQSKKENDQFVSSVANKTPHPELARYKKRVKTFGNGENSKTALGSEPGGIQRRLVADGCEIYNADGPRTCNPLLCNQQRFIFCSRGQTTTTPEKRRCGGYGFELPHYDHICRGCRCRTLPPPRKPRPRLPVPSKDESKEGEGRPQIKWPKVQAEQDKPPASETNQLQRRLVADGCEIYNPEDLPTCKPAECSQQESITCSRPLMRRCVGNGFQLMLYEHVCKGCACRSIPRPQSLHYRENRKRPLLLLPGPEGSPNGTDSQTERPKTRHMHPPEPAEGKGLHHRAVTHPCEISNPNHLDTCKPAQCGAHPLIRCFPSGRHSSTCQSRGLSEEAVDHICRGCWCSRKGSEKAVKAPNDNGMCEVINPRNRPTCNPLACAAHPLVSCSGFPNAHRCRGKGMNNSQVKDICYGCVCALKAGSPPPPRVWKPLGRKPKRPAVVAGGLERNVKLKTGDLESRLGDPSLKGSRGQELAATYFFTGNLGRKALGLPPLPKKEIDVIVKSKSGRMKYSEREIEKDVESKSRRTKYSEKERQI
ncbi:hypothetical protein MMC10_008700 [Thelotrema lepadinum]|nr:hypothetical protein [Thelotrema lepadinum]